MSAKHSRPQLVRGCRLTPFLGLWVPPCACNHYLAVGKFQRRYLHCLCFAAQRVSGSYKRTFRPLLFREVGITKYPVVG